MWEFRCVLKHSCACIFLHVDSYLKNGNVLVSSWWIGFVAQVAKVKENAACVAGKFNFLILIMENMEHSAETCGAHEYKPARNCFTRQRERHCNRLIEIAFEFCTGKRFDLRL